MSIRRLRRKTRKLLRIERRYFGLNDLDRKLEHWINFDNGVFVEAGANNGITQSNTYYFEKFRGWTGLLVEAVPEKAEECRHNRPNATVVNSALGSPEQHGTDVSLTYCDLMTVAQDADLQDRKRDDHIAIGSQIQDLTPYEFSVSCCTLSSLLDAHSLMEIDLLSLDVEGYELPVLEGLDFDRHRPRHILVEARSRRGDRPDSQPLLHDDRQVEPP